LRQRFLSGLYLGSLSAGARLPSLRQIASEYLVEPRAARRAYQLLEREGLVELRERSGIYFAPAVERTRRPLSPRSQWLVNLAADGLARAVPVPELASRVAQFTRASHLRVACIECNDDQSAAMANELTRAFGLAAVPFEVDALLACSDPNEALGDIDLLVTTPFHAGEVEELARRAGRPWLAMSPRADIFGEIAQLLSRGQVYYLVSDSRFAAKLRTIFRNTAHGKRLITLLAGDEHTAVDPGSPLYITHLARQQLAPHVPKQARPSVCVLSPVSSRALLAFIVASNIDPVGAHDHGELAAVRGESPRNGGVARKPTPAASSAAARSTTPRPHQRRSGGSGTR